MITKCPKIDTVPKACQTDILEHLRLGFGEICTILVVCILSLGTWFSLADGLPVILLFLFCQEILTLDLQVEVLRHVWDDVSYHSGYQRNEPLEHEDEGQTGSKIDPVFLLVVVRLIDLVIAWVSTKHGGSCVTNFFAQIPSSVTKALQNHFAYDNDIMGEQIYEYPHEILHMQ